MDVHAIREALSREVSVMDKETVDEMAVPSYVNRNPLIRWIMVRRLSVIAREMRRYTIDRCLDFGCGIGLLETMLTGQCREILVTDLNMSLAKALHDRLNMRNIVYVDHEALSERIPPGSLGAVVAADVLEHVENLDAQIAAFGRMLIKGGLLFLSGPTENLFYRICRRIARYSGQYHVRNIQDIENRLRLAGWQLLRRISLPVPGPLRMFSLTIWRASCSSPAEEA